MVLSYSLGLDISYKNKITTGDEMVIGDSWTYCNDRHNSIFTYIGTNDHVSSIFFLSFVDKFIWRPGKYLLILLLSIYDIEYIYKIIKD